MNGCGFRGIWRISVDPVTQALWRAMMRKNPSYFKDLNRPVECVSWVDMKKIEKIPIEGELKFNTDSANNDLLIFESENEGIVFGVKLVRLIFSQKGILTIDNKQDYTRVLGENMDLNYFSTVQSSTFIDFE